MLSNITYNRSKRMYTYTDPDSGEVFTAPPKAKGELFRIVVSLLDPDVFAVAERIVTKHPQLDRVTWKAVDKVISNGVEIFPAPVDGVMAMVVSSDGMGRYAIGNLDGHLACNCPAFADMLAPLTKSGNRYCSHLLAYHIHLRARETRF